MYVLFSICSFCAEYENVLQRLAQGLSDAVKKYSSQGNRVSALGEDVLTAGFFYAHVTV